MKIKCRLLGLASLLFALSLVVSAVTAYAEEEDGAGDSLSELVSESESASVETDGSESLPDDTDSVETDPPATDPPATNPPATNPPGTDPPKTDSPATDSPATEPPGTTAPTTTEETPVTTPAVTTTAATTTDNRSTEAPILIGSPQTSLHHPLSTDPPTTKPGDTSTGDSDGTSDASSGRPTASPNSSEKPMSGEGASSSGNVDEEGQGGGQILTLALVFGGACIGGALLLIILKTKNRSII